MRKIQIISGTYGHRPEGSQHAKPIDRGGICEVPEEEAQRLFNLGVACPVQGETAAAAMPAEGKDNSGAGIDLSESAEGTGGAGAASLRPEQLKDMTNDKLRELAEDRGISTDKLKTKAQLIEAIVKVEVTHSDEGSESDGEAPPMLAPEAPVV